MKKPTVRLGLFFLLSISITILVMRYYTHYLLTQDYILKPYPGLTRIPHPGNLEGITQPEWLHFPDTISILISSPKFTQGLYEINVHNGEFQPIYDAFRITFSSWSVDRKWIAFWGQDLALQNDPGLWITSKDGNIIPLQQMQAVPRAWSPDASQIVMDGECGPTKRACLLIYNLATQEIVPILQPANKDILAVTSVAWSPGGEKIFLSYAIGFDLPALYLYDITSKQLQRIPIHAPSSIGNSKWLTRGDWIAGVQGDMTDRQLVFIRLQDGCIIRPLPELSQIFSLDFYEQENNIFMVLDDTRGNLYTLDLAQAIAPTSIDELLNQACMKP